MIKSHSKDHQKIITPLKDWVIFQMLLFLDFELKFSAFCSFYYLEGFFSCGN